MNRADEDRFRELVSARSAALLRTAYLLVGDRARAEDLLQTALLKTYCAWGRIEPGAAEAYVRRVMVTTSVSWWRRRSSTESVVAAVPDGGSVDGTADVVEAEAIRQLLLTLPPRQRVVLVLRFYNDMTEVDIAQTLGISRGAVSNHIARGLAALRSRIGEEVDQR